MKIEKSSGRIERRILVGMILQTRVVSRISSKWQPNLFRSRWANLIGELCVDYFKKFGKAPRKNLVPIVERWSQKASDRETVDIVEKFLSGLSAEYETKAVGNSEFIIDLAANHFGTVGLERVTKKLDALAEKGSYDEAVKLIEGFQKINMGLAETVNVPKDREALKRAFLERRKGLIRFKGPLGRFFGRSLQRGGFISLMGPEKRGKTTWLTWFAWQAMLQGLKVAFFSLGDEDENDMMLRFASLASEVPALRRRIKIPYLVKEDDGRGISKTNLKVFEKKLDYLTARKAFRNVSKNILKSSEEFLRLSCHVTDSISIRDMDATLGAWEKEGFIPDVIVGDYMDIVRDENKRGDKRHEIGDTWKAARSLTQKRHCLLLTATQSNALSYETGILTRKHFSENKAKLAHVTGIVGLNQTDDEKVMGVMRLNWVVRRGDRFSEKDCLFAAGCLDIQNPAIKTRFH